MKDLALNLVMPLYFLNLAAPSFFLAIDFLERLVFFKSHILNVSSCFLVVLLNLFFSSVYSFNLNLIKPSDSTSI